MISNVYRVLFTENPIAPRCPPWGDLALLVLVGFCSVSWPNAAAADGASAISALKACVDAHTTPADQQTVTRLLGLAIAGTSPSGATATDLPQDLLALRESAVIDTANLLSRIVQHDCKPAVQVVVSEKTPNRNAIGLVLVEIIGSSQSSIKRAAEVLGLDVLKKMDSNVVLDATQPTSDSQSGIQVQKPVDR